MSSKSKERVDRGHISKIVAFANICIAGVCGLIAFEFARLTLKDIPFGDAVSNANPQYFQAIILSIYIWCWAVGTTVDTRFQSSVYLVDPLGGRVRLGSIAAVLFLAAISLILLWVRNDELNFSLAFACFTAVDISAWLYLRYLFLPPIITATQKKYDLEADYYGQFLLRTVVSQVCGNWKWWRQVFLSAIVLLMIISAISPTYKNAISFWIAKITPGVSPDDIRPLLSDLLLMAFVLVSEVWHFAFRLKTFLVLRLIDELENKYSIRPK